MPATKSDNMLSSLRLGVIDRIVDEKDGSAEAVAAELRNGLIEALDELEGFSAAELVDARYAKYRRMGVNTLCSHS